MNLTSIITISNPNKIFSIDEANEVLPIIERFTKKHEQAVTDLITKQSWLLKSGAKEDRIKELDKEVGRQLVQWGRKIVKLGAVTFGCGFVGFYNGWGYWSWHNGDGSKIKYYHYKTTDVLNRQAVHDEIQKIK